MTTLTKKIVEILRDYKIGFYDGRFATKEHYKKLADRILRAVHENPSIKKGLKLLKKPPHN